MDDEQRDELLTRIDVRTEAMERAIEKLNLGMYGEDGMGGLCARVSSLETFRSNALMIVAGIAGLITLTGNYIISLLPIGGH